MGILEYRTIRSRGAGAHMRSAGTGDGGGGHGMSNTNSGVRHWMTDGVPGHLVLNRNGVTDTLGTNRWPTHETSGKRAIALGRKESGKRVSTPSGQQKTPQASTYGAEWG